MHECSATRLQLSAVYVHRLRCSAGSDATAGDTTVVPQQQVVGTNAARLPWRFRRSVFVSSYPVRWSSAWQLR